eukprot:4510993-Pyramimonas_sp.AAC.1
MTTLLHDAHKELRERRGGLVPEELVRDLAHADDALLMGVDAGAVQELMTYVEKFGANYGLLFNWKK